MALPDEDQPSGLPVPDSSKSFWHSEPSERLLGHRTTEELPETADVVVVGSGITGAFAAWFLLNGLDGEGKGEGASGGASGGRGESVVILEAREACWGATGRNGGHCQPFLYASDPAAGAFELANLAFLRALVARHRVPCAWTDVAGVHAFLSEPLWDAVRPVVDGMKQEFPDLLRGVEVVEKGEEQQRLKELHVPSACGAVVQPRAASLWPYKLVAWVLEGLLGGGGGGGVGFNLQTNTPVTVISPAGDDGGGWKVQTPRGVIRARQVLLATNGYTSYLVPGMSGLVVPVRGQVAALVPPSSSSSTTPGNTMDVSREHSYCFFADPPQPHRDDYLIQRPPGGYFIFGGGRSLALGRGVNEWRDDEVEEPVAEHLRGGLVPPLEVGDGPAEEGGELQADYQWTGIMGYSRDGRPWVGQVPRVLLPSAPDGHGGGLFVCAGFSGHGMPNAVLAAHAVVRAMKGEDPGDGEGRPGGVKYTLPEGFLVTEERVAEARKRESVREMDLGGFGAQFAQLAAARREG